MRNSKFILLLIFSMVFRISLFASFEPIGVGPRAIGLSNAYTALSDDVYSIHYNPAGLSRLRRAEFTSYWGSLYAGLTDGSNLNQLFLGYGQPIGKWGNLGIGYYSFSLTDWYREDIITLSYSKSVTLEFLTKIHQKLDWFSDKKMHVGVSMKSLSKRHFDPEEWTTNAVDDTGDRPGIADPVFENGYSKNGFTTDIGMQLIPAKGYTVGLVILNLIEPDMGLKYADSVTREVKLGLARSAGDVSVSIDLTSKKFVDTDNRLLIGAEKYFFSGLGVRGGLAIGSREFRQITFGFSYKIESLQFDYGLLLPLNGIGDAFGNHRVGLTFRFGRVYDEDRDEARLMREIEARLKAENEAKEARKEVDEALRTQRQLETALKESEQARFAAERALKTARIKLQKEGESASAKALKAGENRSIATEYANSLTYYNRRVREGINLVQRTTMLGRILAKYKKGNIDLTAVEQELAAVKNQYKQNMKDYKVSMDYYKRIISKSSSEQEKIELLKSIKEKYEDSVIDLSAVESELRRLQ